MLCAPLFDPSIETLSRAKGADLIEWRIDLFKEGGFEKLKALKKTHPHRSIFTFKNVKEETLFSYLELEPDYVDLDISQNDLLLKVKKLFPQVKTIASSHDFSKTGSLTLPDVLTDIYKIATYANSILDALRMLLFLKQQKKPVIGLCMGPLGVITRILAPIFGSYLTYATLSLEESTAPGQLTLDELIHIYNYPLLNRQTTVFGLIGDPIDKSPGHIFHNALFKEKGENSVYVKLQVRESELKEALELATQLGILGFSVTMPLKEAIFQGESINTLSFKGAFQGTNTDGPGAISLIEEKIDLKGKRVSILGCGGTAHAIAKEAKKQGAKVTLFNRSEKRGKALASHLSLPYLPLEKFGDVDYDVVVQATSSCDPIPLSLLKEKKIAFEVIHFVDKTPFLQEAEKKGCLLINGKEFYKRQANLQHEAWK